MVDQGKKDLDQVLEAATESIQGRVNDDIKLSPLDFGSEFIPCRP